MTQNALRITAVAIAVGDVTVVSLVTEPHPRAGAGDPSVPPAWQVLHANDGRSQDNVEDKTY